MRNRPALFVEDALPGDDIVFCDLFPLHHLAADGFRKILLEERAHLVAEGDFFVVEAKVHDIASMDFEYAGGTHAAADAHRDDAALGLAATALDQNVAGHARPAHAVRMADRDGAAVDIESLLRDAEPVAAIKRLAREGLVQFPDIDVAHRKCLI